MLALLGLTSYGGPLEWVLHLLYGKSIASSCYAKSWNTLRQQSATLQKDLREERRQKHT